VRSSANFLRAFRQVCLARLLDARIIFLAQFRSNHVAKHVLTTTFYAAIGKGVGFLVPFFIAAWFGVSSETDAFFFAYGLILLLTIIFSSVVESVIVPYLAEARAAGNDVGSFVGNVLASGGIAMGLIAAFFLLVSKPVLGVVSNFSANDLQLIQLILLQASPLVVLLVWTSVISGTFYTLKLFRIPALSPAFRALITLVSILLLKDKYGIHAVASGYVIAEICHLGLLAYLLRQFTPIRLDFSFKGAGEVRKFIKTSSYMIFGMSIMAFSPIINKTMASWLGPANVSILEYADRLYQIPLSLISLGLLPVLLSHWSEDFYTTNIDEIKRRVVRTVYISGVGVFAVSILFVLISAPLAQLAYGRGKFSHEYVAITADVFSLYVIGLGPSLVGLVLGRAFLVFRRTKVFVVFGALNVLVNVSLNFVLMPVLGIYGLALSTTFAYSVVSVGMLFYFRSCRLTL